jgi:hypothetical protein
MSEPEPIHFRESIPEIPRVPVQHVRAVGAPLSMGASSRQPQPAPQGNSLRFTSTPAPGRSLPAPAPDDASGMQRAVNAFRSVMPIVQKILPLLDGNFGTAVANLIAPRPHVQPALPQKVDLTQLEEGLTRLQSQQLGLREQVVEQNTALKRVEDQLQHVREATDRNTLEQQELLEDLKAFSGKVKVVAILGMGLLAAGFLLELMMFFHLQKVLP